MVNDIIQNAANKRMENTETKTESAFDDSFTTATLDHLETDTTGIATSTLPKTVTLPSCKNNQSDFNNGHNIGRSQSQSFGYLDSGFMSSHHVEPLNVEPLNVEPLNTRPTRPLPPDSPIASEEFREGV